MPAIEGFYQASPTTVATNTYRCVQVDSQGRIVTVSAGSASGAVTQVGGVYNVVAPTLTNGSAGAFQLDVNGNQKVTLIDTSPSLFANFGANTTLNVKGTAGVVLSATCSNTNAAARYLQLHNTATVPAGGGVPLMAFYIPAAGAIILDNSFFTRAGVAFATGIAFAVSTTAGTFTAATAAEHNTQVLYR